MTRRESGRRAPRSGPRARAARADTLRSEHDRLCFLRAFPPTRFARRRAEQALARFERRSAGVRAELEDSGIAGTLYRYPYSYATARWMAQTYGRAVTIDWDAYKRRPWDDLATMLAVLVSWAEMDGLDDEDAGSWDWVRRAAARASRSDLSWLLERLAAAGLSTETERHLYEAVDLPLTWNLAGSGDSITHLVLPARRPLFSREILRERPADFAAAVRQPIGPLVNVAPSRAIRAIRAARAALSLRAREFHVIVHANPAETYRTECGRGLEIITFGLPAPLRLPLEADYGCLLLRNGVPIGYAYAALLFERCDIGINIFPTYRDGESAYAFTQVAGLFYQHFGARVFIMRRYQVGHGNPEGIEAGAFWFYWKLGFRPLDARVRALADAEAHRLSRRKRARSDPAMLRRLARRDLVWSPDPLDVTRYRDYDVAAVGCAVTRLIERRYGGDRRAAEEDSARRVARSLGVARIPPKMATIATLIGDLGRWPKPDKRALAAALRGKFAIRERSYVLALARAGRFRRFIAQF